MLTGRWADVNNVPLVREEILKPGSLLTLLNEAVAKFSDKLAFKIGDFKMTYKELGHLTSIIAGNLRLYGLEKQQKVLIFLPNTPQTVIAIWSVARGGCTCVMTNPLYSESELLHQVTDSESTMIITCDLLLSKVKSIIDKTNVTDVFVVKLSEEEQKYDDPRIHTWDDLLKGNRGYSCKTIEPQKDLAFLQYTGGTTGVSKGCMITHANALANCQQVSSMFTKYLIEGQEAFICVLPYFHSYGLMVSVLFPTMIGASQTPLPRFSPKGFLATIQKERITAMPSAPSIFNACITQKDIDSYDLSSLKVLISGSAPLSLASMQAFEKKTGAIISEGYGLSEASPVTHFSNMDFPKKEGSIGMPLPFTEAKIVDVEYGIKELGPGEQGELCIRGPQVMLGYYKHKVETDLVIRDGWLYTGDIARFDEDGYFYITDRKKDLIICGGYNVYPREVEEVLYKYPKVREAAVIGAKSETRGEIVKAFVVLKEGETADAKEIIAYCRQNLANYKVPREVVFKDNLPKSAVGKILRRQLQDEK